mgnify:CR=1 FL=1
MTTARQVKITSNGRMDPIAPRRPHSFTTHGITIVDDYAWLKDANWQEVLRDPAVQDKVGQAKHAAKEQAEHAQHAAQEKAHEAQEAVKAKMGTHGAAASDGSAPPSAPPTTPAPASPSVTSAVPDEGRLP